METIRYSPIGKEDISFGTGSFEVTLADGRVVMLTQVDVGALLNAGLSTTTLVGLTLSSPTLSGTIVFSSTPSFPTLTAKSMLYTDGTSILTSTAAPTNGQLLIGSTGAIPVLATLTAGSGITITNAAGAITIASLPRSYLAGYGLSTAGSSTTMTIAAGQATDSTNAQNITRASSIAKTTASWSVGTAAGGLDTGSIAPSTWYHFFAILRTDTGVTDVLFSTSATSPTMPANYVYFRRIASWKTDGSSNWTSMTQDGDYFRLAASVLDINSTNPGTSAVSATLASVPSGINVHALMNFMTTQGGAVSQTVYVSDLSATDEAPIQYNANPAVPGATMTQFGVSGTGPMMQIMIRTNTSQAIRYRLFLSDASTKVGIITLGWFDRRGRDS